jgi:hypothetical protein
MVDLHGRRCLSCHLKWICPSSIFICRITCCILLVNYDKIFKALFWFQEYFFYLSVLKNDIQNETVPLVSWIERTQWSCPVWWICTEGGVCRVIWSEYVHFPALVSLFSIDCGVFAIAYATEFCFNQYTGGKGLTFNTSVMRDHLLQCLSNKQIDLIIRIIC